MGNSLRCCLGCVVPCGAVDLIRVVHLNGCVEEITGPITAGEVFNTNPNYVLSKPSSQGRILILSPQTQLKRGTIYFLNKVSSINGVKRSHDFSSSPASKENKMLTPELWLPRLESISEL